MWDASPLEDEQNGEEMLRITAHGATDIGCRKNNQDEFLIHVDSGLFVVTDGLGGHDKGEVASRIAIDTIGYVASLVEATRVMNELLPLEMLYLAFMQAHAQICREQRKFDPPSHMGTTAVAGLIFRHRLTLANTGDSRGYIFRQGSLRQVTQDHSFWNRLVQDQPDLLDFPANIRERMKLEVSHRLTQSLGKPGEVVIDLTVVELREKDVLLLCTDGLTDVVTVESIEELLSANEDLERACQALIGQAKQSGGQDNVTVVLARVEGGELIPPSLADVDELTYENVKQNLLR